MFGAALIALGVLSTLGWQSTHERVRGTPDNPRSSNGSAETASRWMEGIGYVEPRSELRRLTFKTSGVISRCRYKVGDRVGGGEIIAELDDAAAKVAVEGARRKLDYAR